MKKRSWNRGDVFVLAVLFYFLGMLTSFLFYLFLLLQAPELLPAKKDFHKDYSRLYTLGLNEHAAALPDEKQKEQFPSHILTQRSHSLDKEIWETTTVIRSALYQFVVKRGYMPRHLSELMEAFPENYLTQLPNDPITLSNDVVHTFTGTGGWVYNPASVSGQKGMEWKKIVEQSLVPNVHLISSIEFYPLEILIIKERNELRLVSGPYTLNTYEVGLGEKNSTPEGRFAVQKKVMNPNKWKGPLQQNPFGSRGMELSEYAIHGTNDSTSIGKNVSKGCIRMHNEDIAELYAMVPIYTPVEILMGDNGKVKEMPKKADKIFPNGENEQVRNKQLYEQDDQLKEEDPDQTYMWKG
ncbi:L,D-transpeptidase [Priestia abyssalis]|uniref:L,D-transpeptidase n=1 Tax=Priestia abyssalis TaxID=1221450 RepID=UPI0009954ADC|nr:L,D-transpeptidase [Priestia abyssalis]